LPVRHFILFIVNNPFDNEFPIQKYRLTIAKVIDISNKLEKRNNLIEKAIDKILYIKYTLNVKIFIYQNFKTSNKLFKQRKRRF
jgi:hypothetical protein